MGFYKLREWVGTVTGKGVRWGRDKVGRSEPAFLAASTTALPPSTSTARREAGQLCGQLLLCCEAGQLLAVVFEACAGRRVRRLCLPAAAWFCRLCLPALFCGLCACSPLPCHAHCPSHHFAPVLFILLCPLFIPCAPGSSCFRTNKFASCKTVLLAAATRACSGGPCAGSLLTLFFPSESMILGHG